MRKKFLTFLLAICFILPCVFMLSACKIGNGGDNTPSITGYEVYINGTKTNEFQCMSGQNAITSSNITIKSKWTDESKNTNIPLGDFDISVKWNDKFNIEQTTMPDFWTNGTGSTTNDYATTYLFTLTLKSDNVWTTTFSVIISPITVSNLHVRIFDGTEYKYSAEMIWGHNERESDTSKHFKFDIENLDEGYDQHEHIQWALIEKETYDALETPAQKKDFIQNSQSFSSGQIYSHYEPGIYYVFAYVPEWNNKQYGEDGDGKIYDYATLTIKPIELLQTPEIHVLSHDEYHKIDFAYTAFDINSELTATVDYDYSSYISTQPYVYENGNWNILEKFEIIDEPDNYDILWKSIKAHAILTADGYKLVDLKDIEISKTEWVFINDDGTKGEDVTDNSTIKVVDYRELSQYKNGTSITIPTYYMVEDTSSQSIYLDCSKFYKTEVKIKKYTDILTPKVEVGQGGAVAAKYVTASNTFEFTYGEKYQLSWASVLNSPAQIMENVIGWSTHWGLTGFNETEYSEEPYYGYVSLESPHYAWKLDGVNYTSEPLKITYYINKKAEIKNPTYIAGSNYTDYFTTPIEIAYDSTRESYSLDDIITIGNVVDEDICFELDWVNVYSYQLTPDDESLSRDELIQTIREKGTNVGYSECFASEEENVIGKTFVIMYDLTNTNNTTWENDSVIPKIFKITIVDAE